MITWHTDTLDIDQITTILGSSEVVSLLACPDKPLARIRATHRAAGAWDANKREVHAAYKSLARILNNAR